MKLLSTTLTLFASLLLASAAQADTITILSELGTPVQGAQMTVGDESTSTTLVSDGQGNIELPKTWKAAVPVTIRATGFVSKSLLGALPVTQTVILSREELRAAIEVKGQTTGFPQLKRDGLVDFGLVMPALKPQDLTLFDLTSLISPDMDTIDLAFEEVAVPSNLTLPEQRESYFIPITFDKPEYRMGFKKTGDYKTLALHGQFPLKEVVDDLRAGKKFYDIIKYFSIKGGGTRDIEVSRPLTAQNIAINQMTMNKKTQMKAPAALPDLIMFSFPLDEANGLYFPTDIKKVEAGQTVQLALPNTSAQHSVLSLVMSKSEADSRKDQDKQNSVYQIEEGNEVSVWRALFEPILNIFGIEVADERAQIQAGTGLGGISTAHHKAGLEAPQFLGLIAPPTYQDFVLRAAPPAVVSGIEPVRTVAILSEIVKTKKGKHELTNMYQVWSVSQDGWVAELSMPSGLRDLPAGKTYEWTIFYLGRDTNINSSPVQSPNAVTHVTRNSMRF